METELRSSYVAKSEFGAYQEQVDAKFTATAENVTQSIRYVSELEGRLDEQAGDLQGLISYRTETKGYIRQGIVGYEDTVPTIGIAIGQDIQTTGHAERGREDIRRDRHEPQHVGLDEQEALILRRGRGDRVFLKRCAACGARGA